jgi:hypothetical protein
VNLAQIFDELRKIDADGSGVLAPKELMQGRIRAISCSPPRCWLSGNKNTPAPRA